MLTFTINSQAFEFDESLEYADFFINKDEPVAVSIDWKKLLSGLQGDGALVPPLPWNQNVSQYFRYLSRWVHEAPRKRHYREMKLAGMGVLSSEYFFEGEGGDVFINTLENTGKLAARVCEAFGVEPMRPLKNEDPFSPINGPLENFEQPK